MVVDFVLRNAPEMKVATLTMKGRWPGDKPIREEFEKLHAWTRSRGLKTGKWVFRELGDMTGPESSAKWEVGIEVRGKGPLRGGGGVSIKTLPATKVASVTFDPDVVSARLVYHGISDWLRWREKFKEWKSVGPYREMYSGNPWTSKSAWAHTQVQAPVKKAKS